MEHETNPDLAYGTKAIARHLGLTERQALHLKEKGLLPTFYIGSTICALKSKLNAWLSEQAEGGRK